MSAINSNRQDQHGGQETRCRAVRMYWARPPRVPTTMLRPRVTHRKKQTQETVGLWGEAAAGHGQTVPRGMAEEAPRRRREGETLNSRDADTSESVDVHLPPRAKARCNYIVSPCERQQGTTLNLRICNSRPWEEADRDLRSSQTLSRRSLTLPRPVILTYFHTCNSLPGFINGTIYHMCASTL